MRKAALFSVALTAATVAGVYQWQHRVAPTIEIAFEEKGSVGSVQVPAVDGYVGGISGISMEGNREICQRKAGYKVAANTTGHLFILAHYEIERSGVVTQVDRALPILGQKSAPAMWIKLDDHSLAAAYLTGTNIS